MKDNIMTKREREEKKSLMREKNDIKHSWKRKKRVRERHEDMKREREEWEKQKQEEKTRREEEKEKREREKQISVEQIQRLKSEMERIIREKERIERERREQLEDSEKRLTEERNMREDQQKTLEDKLKLLEEQHENELKRRRVECREEYERENEEIKKKKICSETDHSLQDLLMSLFMLLMIVVHNRQRRRRSKQDPPQMRIVLLGWSVSENSHVGNFILGRAAFDSEAPPDVVERVAGRLKDRHVIIINSPQLLQTNISDLQITQTHTRATETNDILQKIIQKCANRHFSLQTSSSPHDLLQTLEDIVKMNDGRHLDCAEEGVKLNLVVYGSDETLKSSISEQILQQTDRRSDRLYVDYVARL
ncbi:GTPase IMAP family member 7-like isoform X1 [Labeo rohita]|uniref:GTPase IMAP family member 7-like isoform X1 n=1 Tax=Labeo rohita TaxID=84645 RepID=A0A498LV19_LABRO|nr:GTPase IMAP family member 7-like isoform X1 [Labeo rohita]